MINLIPLCTAVVEVGTSWDVGAGPAGSRSVAEIRSAVFQGERFNASMAGVAAADWMLANGPVAVIDVRMTLKTDDGALIFMQYGGRLDREKRENGLHAYSTPVFETGDERYAWLNGIQAVGKGRILPGPDGVRIEYEFYELR
jgi:hypothetical protein